MFSVTFDDPLFSPSHESNQRFPEISESQRRDNIIVGYKLAADELVERTEAEPGKKHSLVFPIGFCYRHFLELMLKARIAQIESLLGADNRERWHHGLQELWDDLTALIEDNDVDQSAISSHVVAADYINQFNTIDPRSLAFRYEFWSGYDILDLIKLKEKMQATEHYFLELRSSIQRSFEHR